MTRSWRVLKLSPLSRGTSLQSVLCLRRVRQGETTSALARRALTVGAETSQELDLALVRPKKRRTSLTLDSETVKIASRFISAESSAQSQMPDGVKVLEERELLLP